MKEFSQIEIENAVWKIDGYYSQSSHERTSGCTVAAFTRAKAELIKNLLCDLETAKSIDHSQWIMHSEHIRYGRVK